MFTRRLLLLGAACAALLSPAAANAVTFQVARFKGTLHGTQDSSWTLDRTDTTASCTVETIEKGKERLSFRTPKPESVQISSYRGGPIAIDTAPDYDGANIATDADVTRESTVKIILSGPCAAKGQPAPQTTQCGTVHIHGYMLRLVRAFAAKTWVTLSPDPEEPAALLSCPAQVIAYPELLSRYEYTQGEPIATQLPKAKLFDPNLRTIVTPAGGDYTGTVNQAQVDISLRWKLTLVRK